MLKKPIILGTFTTIGQSMSGKVADYRMLHIRAKILTNLYLHQTIPCAAFVIGSATEVAFYEGSVGLVMGLSIYADSIMLNAVNIHGWTTWQIELILLD